MLANSFWFVEILRRRQIRINLKTFLSSNCKVKGRNLEAQKSYILEKGFDPFASMWESLGQKNEKLYLEFETKRKIISSGWTWT